MESDYNGYETIPVSCVTDNNIPKIIVFNPNTLEIMLIWKKLNEIIDIQKRCIEMSERQTVLMKEINNARNT